MEERLANLENFLTVHYSYKSDQVYELPVPPHDPDQPDEPADADAIKAMEDAKAEQPPAQPAFQPSIPQPPAEEKPPEPAAEPEAEPAPKKPDISPEGRLINIENFCITVLHYKPEKRY